MGLIKEFKEFALKGNVMDMAVGVLIGGAFSGIVTALTTDFINPLISLVGGSDIAGKTKIGEHWVDQVNDNGDSIKALENIYIEWGHFITAIINFLIMAFVLFLLIKGMNKLKDLGKKKEEEKPEEPAEPSDEVKLLGEIKDLLAANQNK